MFYFIINKEINKGVFIDKFVNVLLNRKLVLLLFNLLIIMLNLVFYFDFDILEFYYFFLSCMRVL